MVNKIKNNSTQGLYFTEEQGGSIAGNTPGEIDLDSLVLGDTYIYFDTINRFEEKTTYNREGEDFIGFKTWQSGAASVQASTGGGKRTYFLITVECDETTAEHLKTFGVRNVKAGDGIKYLIKQTASEVFEQFPNSAAALKKAVAIIIRGHDIAEIGEAGKDVKLINIACEQISSR